MFLCLHGFNCLTKDLEASRFFRLEWIPAKERQYFVYKIFQSRNFILDVWIPTVSLIREIVDTTAVEHGLNPFKYRTIVRPKFDFELQFDLSLLFQRLMFTNADGKTAFTIDKPRNVLRV